MKTRIVLAAFGAVAATGASACKGDVTAATEASGITWSGDADVPAFSVQSPLPADLEALLGGEAAADAAEATA